MADTFSDTGPGGGPDSGGSVGSRAQFAGHTQRALARDRRDGTSVGVLVVNVGGNMADEGEVVIEITDRMQAVVPSAVSVAMIGDRSFGLLVDDLATPFAAVNVLERLRDELRSLLTWSAVDAPLVLSLGVDLHEGRVDPGLSAAHSEMMIERAEAAAAMAAEQGGDRYEIFDPQLREECRRRVDMRDELHAAIDDGHLRVHYQPTLRLADRRVTMAEALARWEHPTRGLVPAGEFIGLAEEYGLILPLGAWVLFETAQQRSAWEAELGDAAPRLSVNLAATQLWHPKAVNQLASTLAATGVRPEGICIEINESVLMSDPEASLARLTELQELGIRLAIDNYGSSHCSLIHLRRLPIDVVKIDRSLVQRAPHDDRDRAVLSAVARLASDLDIEVVAEGVEDDEQLELMAELGCDHAQGYHVGRPQDADVLRPLLGVDP